MFTRVAGRREEEGVRPWPGHAAQMLTDDWEQVRRYCDVPNCDLGLWCPDEVRPVDSRHGAPYSDESFGEIDVSSAQLGQFARPLAGACYPWVER